MRLLNDIKYSLINDKGDINTSLEHSADILNNKLNDFNKIQNNGLIKNKNYVMALNTSANCVFDHQFKQGDKIVIINPTEHLVHLYTNARAKCQLIVGYGKSSITSYHSKDLVGTLYPYNSKVMLEVIGTDASTFTILEEEGFEINNPYMNDIDLRFKVCSLAGVKNNNEKIPIWYDSLSNNAFKCNIKESMPYLKKYYDSRNSIHFKGLNKYLDLNRYRVTQPNTYIFIAKANVSDVLTVFLDTAVIARHRQMIAFDDENRLSMYAGKWIFQEEPKTNFTKKFHVFEFVFNSDSSTIYVDGKRLVMTSNDTGTHGITTGIRLCNSFGANLGTDLEIVEFCLINKILEETDRRNILKNYKCIYPFLKLEEIW